MSWQILEGDCRTVLAGLPAQSVHTVVTSPPYFGLRDYGHQEQIGLEPSPDEFVAALVGVFRKVRRVLRDDGTVWLNLGDSYAGGNTASGDGEERSTPNGQRGHVDNVGMAQRRVVGCFVGCKPKDLIGIPWMVAFALRADGWYLRSEIIWHKPNPMPESVTDRPTKSHEQLFLLSKSPRYFYDADAVREDGRDWSTGGPGTGIENTAERYGAGNGGNDGLASLAERYKAGEVTAGRNRRSVWVVATQPYAGAHFATFPPKLIEPCILAGCPERCCSGCGASWVRIVERTPMVVRPSERRADWQGGDERARTQTGGTMLESATSRTVGFEPSCGCAADPMPGTVLDPFAGAGTTGMVALRHNRSFVGIELNAEYAQLARHRICDDAPLFNSVSELVA